jgi:DNA-binding CsgD family transcriptional regulator
MAEDAGNGLDWLFTPDLSKELNIEDEQSFFESPRMFKGILESIQDGVSIIDTELNIKYMNTTMRHIYIDEKDALLKKCYTVYHGRSGPCVNCPSLQTIETKSPHTNIMQYEHDGHEKNWHQVFSIPVVNKKNEVILVVEYIRDITFQNNVMDRMKELTRRFEALEHRNQILADSLAQQEQHREEFEKQINTNVERFIKPSLEYLKKTAGEEEVGLVSSLIDELIYPIARKRDTLLSDLTSRELQVAALIKKGKASKEIADDLCITQKAVDFHRLNIRKKLKLQRRTNLQTFLETHL